MSQKYGSRVETRREDVVIGRSRSPYHTYPYPTTHPNSLLEWSHRHDSGNLRSDDGPGRTVPGTRRTGRKRSPPTGTNLQHQGN